MSCSAGTSKGHHETVSRMTAKCGLAAIPLQQCQCPWPQTNNNHADDDSHTMVDLDHSGLADDERGVTHVFDFVAGFSLLRRAIFNFNTENQYFSMAFLHRSWWC